MWRALRSAAEEPDQLLALAIAQSGDRLDGAIRHWLSERAALAGPTFGSASRSSYTFAVLANSGGWAMMSSIRTLPDASSLFSPARLIRISFACRNARMR